MRGTFRRFTWALYFLSLVYLSPSARGQFFNLGAFWKAVSQGFSFDAKWLGIYASSRSEFSFGNYPLDSASTGVGDDTMDMPRQAVSDANYVYIVERCKLSRWTRAGSFEGWVGRISSAPTGGDVGCNGGSGVTPGWCKGGVALCTTSDGAISSGYGVAVSGTNIYVASSSSRIMRFTTAGVYVGWFGKISTTPTAGDPGCSGATGVTPGWCRGGTSQSGSEDGAYSGIEQFFLSGSYLYIAETGNYRVSRVSVPNVSAQGWIGGYYLTNDGFQTDVGFGTNSTANEGDLANPQFSHASGSYLYLTDTSAARISRFLLPSGTKAGWIGRISTAPTGGDAGCSGASGYTPGWCSGGVATSGTGDGMLQGPKGVVVSGTNLYVADSSNSRIVRYNTSGLFIGWTGRINNAPNGGDPGCSGATGATPGWCRGGAATSGTGTGHLNFPSGIAVAGGNIFVSDESSNRIVRINESTGVFTGWYGRISTAPTGGDVGCSGASGTTPGWCMGGTAQSGTGNGQFWTLSGMVSDGTSLYVVDTSNYRIAKLNTNGTYEGWLGRINIAATGGAAGCTVSGASPPGWCLGGTSQGNTNDGRGSFGTPRAITIWGTDIFTLESATWPRVQKYNKDTGAFGGWLGKILTSPTGGDAGCNGASVGSWTPGWCKGGTAAVGVTDTTGAPFNQPYGLATEGNYLYVSDIGSPRASKYDITNGTYYGWIGRRTDAKTSFTSIGTPVNNANYDGIFNGVYGIAGEGSYLYVATSNRVKRYTTGGLYQGWMGHINSTPNGGDPGCSGSVTNVFTPGWCRGGTAGTSSSILGSLSTSGRLTAAGGYLYIADTSAYRFQKYTAATATPHGWMGIVRAAPTAGDAGCNGATLGQRTPGWCKGGLAAATPVDGSFINPTDVHSDGTYLYMTDANAMRLQRYALDGSYAGWAGKSWAASSWGTGATPVNPGVTWTTGEIFYNLKDVATDGSYIYVVDNSAASVKRFDALTGAVAGWVGKTSTTYIPTGGAAGCEGLINAKTPGWCIGGMSAAVNDGNTPFWSPQGAMTLGSYLYVTDTTNKIHRIVKGTGVYTGWLGYISSTPNAGDPGCSGASGMSPGWCLGGGATSNTGQGFSGTPGDLETDGVYIYVADKGNHRVTRYLASSGSFQGWIGRINAAPTGGAAGCSGGSGGTPGWCMGGTSQSGSAAGQLNNPIGVAVAGSYLYVVENTTARLNKFDKTSGAYVGWVGRIATAPTGGAAGCSGTSSGVTPGWCAGGTSVATQNADGSIYDAQDVDASTNYLYVSDGNHKISRYELGTGAFAGWYGKINSAPTGGPTGCAGASGVTVNWCKGGMATSGSGYGELNQPQGLAVNGTNLYISEYTNKRVTKISISP